MAKQKSILTFEGTLEGLNFYFRKGKPVVRAAGGGFSSQKVKNNPSMIRVRENAKEFGTCSRFGKMIRTQIQQLMDRKQPTDWHYRFVSLLQKLKIHDTQSTRGNRSIWLALQDNEAINKLKEIKLFTENFQDTLLKNRTSYDLSQGIIRWEAGDIVAPNTATHLQIRVGLLAFDLVSENISLTSISSQRISIESFTEGVEMPLIAENLSLINCPIVMIIFEQENNGTYYALTEDKHQIGYFA